MVPPTHDPHRESSEQRSRNDERDEQAAHPTSGDRGGRGVAANDQYDENVTEGAAGIERPVDGVVPDTDGERLVGQ